MQRCQYAYIGTWGADLQGQEKKQQASGGGIKIYRVNPDGAFQYVATVSPEVNAGIIHISPDRRYLYTTDERKDLNGKYGNGGGVCAYRINQEDGTLEFLNAVSSVGPYPCYVVADRENKYAFVANHGNHEDVVTKVRITPDGKYEAVRVYDDGSIAMFLIKADGSLGECCDVKILEGKSVDGYFQRSPHPHSVWIDPTNRFLIIGDKGADSVIVYRIDYRNGKLIEASVFKSLPGSGPRHIAFHPELPVMYVNNEINSTVNAFRFDFDTGSIELIDTARTIPDPYIPPDPLDHFASNATADMRVHRTGKFLYVSNRGHNSIASYEIDRAGKLKLIGFTPTNGQIPRAINFDLTGDKLYAVNQRTGNIVEFLVDESTGELTPTGNELRLSNPVCIQFAQF
ncbi:lactonase family protein [Cohnella laeviribosi]|uniref:lactonase family protein n=1 Tax=Cohnella laeviribosi TaxID=380174 RepID=UPI000363B14E|nr:lactonase family protein [Cohnella laeviribosi]